MSVIPMFEYRASGSIQVRHGKGDKRMSWHQCRHAYAAWSFVDGTDLRTIQLQLRHLQGLGVSKSQEAVYSAPVPSNPRDRAARHASLSVRTAKPTSETADA